MNELWTHAGWLWLKARRHNAPHNADIWHLRHHAGRLLPQIWQQVQDGTYRLNPILQVSWRALNAIRIKRRPGRLARGFDWCGVQFTAGESPRISDRSLMKHRERCRRLDEQLRARVMAQTAITAQVSSGQTWLTACSVPSARSKI